MRIFKCSVCDVFPFGSVYTCCAGHPVCAECRPTIRKCQRLLCNQPLISGRNLEMENRINLGRFGCLHRIYGCQKMLRLSVYEKHLINCKYRPYCCPSCKLHVPVVPSEFEDLVPSKTTPEIIEDGGNMDTADSVKKHFIDGNKDPWLCWEPPESIQGISTDETVAMKPTPTMGRPTASVRHLFRDGNAYNTLIVSELKGKRKNRRCLFF